MKKNFLNFIIILVLPISGLLAQSSMMNTWYFGHYAGLDFSSGNPIPLSNGQINNNEGCTVVSDDNGDLLFYTDGVTVWNRNHVAMPNGTGLNGGTSTTQTLIVKKPSNCLQYYIFHQNGQWDLQLFYSVVDMTLDGGLGDVVVSTKNTFLYYPATEKMTAVTHQNGSDVWVIFHEDNSNKFMSYLVTATGINSPVNTNVGPVHVNMIGYMKASHNGNKLATAITFTPDIRAEIYDFNNATGIMSNPVIFNNWNGCYGLEFSPNDNFLYVTAYWNTNYLYQIDLSNNSLQTITSASNGNYDMAALQLAPNGKIYMARNNQNYLSVINDPNISGVGCNFVTNGVNLSSGTYGILGLPNFNQGAYNIPTSSFNFTQLSCGMYNFNSVINGAYNSLAWNFGDINSGLNNTSTSANPQHSFSSSGNYNVTLLIYSNCGNDTVHQQISVSNTGLNINLGNDTLICSNSPLQLDAGNPGSSYLWSTGASSQTITVSSNGNYWVLVTNSGCSGADTINVSFITTPTVNLGNDTSLCPGSSLQLNAGNPGCTYLWSTGSTNQSIPVTSTGLYWVIVHNGNCSDFDSIQVNFQSVNVDLGNDTMLCGTSSFVLDAGNSGVSFLWSTGATTQTISVSVDGLYSVTVTSQQCIGVDSIQIIFSAPPMTSLGNDTTLCPGTSINLNAGSPGATYLWSTGAITQNITVSSQAYYSVTVTIGNCLDYDTIHVFVIPQIDLGKDVSLCNTNEVTLSTNVPSEYYLWSTGSMNQSITVSEAGIFWITAQSGICLLSDTIEVTGGDFSLYIPNAFTPDNDGLNEIFTPIGQGIAQYHLMIFTRWGQMIFESNDITVGWDGKFKGSLCQIGIYAWLLEYGTICTGDRDLRKYGFVILLK